MGFGKSIVFFSEPGDLIIAPTFVGVYSSPVDNASNTNPTFSVVPPSGLIKGDLVIVSLSDNTTQGSATCSNQGGQTFDYLGRIGNSNQQHTWFATFNGSWPNNPIFVKTNTVSAPSLQMVVFRGYRTDVKWTNIIDQSSNTSGTSYVSNFGTIPDNRCLLLDILVINSSLRTITFTGNKWSQSGLSAQYRNTSGSTNGLFYIGQDYLAIPSSLSISWSGAATGGINRRLVFKQTVI